MKTDRVVKLGYDPGLREGNRGAASNLCHTLVPLSPAALPPTPGTGVQEQVSLPLILLGSWLPAQSLQPELSGLIQPSCAGDLSPGLVAGPCC